VLTSYSEAIVSKDWPLAWSFSPIISRQNFVPPEYSWGGLQLRSPPAFSTVLKHLQVIDHIVLPCFSKSASSCQCRCN
jgi:sacsin